MIDIDWMLLFKLVLLFYGALFALVLLAFFFAITREKFDARRERMLEKVEPDLEPIPDSIRKAFKKNGKKLKL